MNTCTTTVGCKRPHARHALATLTGCLILASMALLPAPPAHAANDASCGPLLKAQTALKHAPIIRETITLGSRKPHEMIATATRLYTQQPDGSWVYAQFSMATRNKLVHMFGKGKLTDCRLLRSERINGETADVYTVTSHGHFSKKNTVTVWVSRASGLPLKSEGDVHRLFGGTEHMSELFSYHNVHAPANAKEEINMDRIFGGH